MADFRPFSPCWGDISFTEAPRTTARCYAGAIFLSRSPFGATARARGVAWLRCPRVAGPGRASGQRASHASVHQAPPVWRASPVWRARLRCPRVAGPGRTTRRRTEPHVSTPGAAGVDGGGQAGGPGCGAGGRRRGLAGLREDTPISDPAPLVWRAPEGPEGTGGLRGAAPNEVRTPSLAGGRARRRPEHPWGHKQSSPAP